MIADSGAVRAVRAVRRGATERNRFSPLQSDFQIPASDIRSAICVLICIAGLRLAVTQLPIDGKINKWSCRPPNEWAYSTIC